MSLAEAGLETHGRRCTCCEVHSTCHAGPQKKPRKPAGPPTASQLAARKVFADKVKAAKAMQAQNPDLSYRDAIKLVHEQYAQS